MRRPLPGTHHTKPATPAPQQHVTSRRPDTPRPLASQRVDDTSSQAADDDTYIKYQTVPPIFIDSSQLDTSRTVVTTSSRLDPRTILVESARSNDSVAGTDRTYKPNKLQQANAHAQASPSTTRDRNVVHFNVRGKKKGEHTLELWYSQGIALPKPAVTTLPRKARFFVFILQFFIHLVTALEKQTTESHMKH